MNTQHPLTPMQIRCVQLIAEGHLHKTISPMLGIAAKTVGNHIAAAMRRVKARNATHLVAEGFRNGWIQ